MSLAWEPLRLGAKSPPDDLGEAGSVEDPLTILGDDHGRVVVGAQLPAVLEQDRAGSVLGGLILFTQRSSVSGVSGSVRGWDPLCARGVGRIALRGFRRLRPRVTRSARSEGLYGDPPGAYRYLGRVRERLPCTLSAGRVGPTAAGVLLPALRPHRRNREATTLVRLVRADAMTVERLDAREVFAATGAFVERGHYDEAISPSCFSALTMSLSRYALVPTLPVKVD